MASTSIVPFLIQQEVEGGNQFTGATPATGPEIEGVVFRYKNRNEGGAFCFTNRRFMSVRRIMVDFKDAQTWKIEVEHTDTVQTRTLLFEGQSQVVTFEVTGGTDGLYTITIDGVNYQHSASGQTATQISDALLALIDVDLSADEGRFVSVSGAIITLVSVEGSSFGVASTGDPITATETQTSDGEDSKQRFDAVNLDLAPGENILVTTTGATELLLAEVLAFPTRQLLANTGG